MSPSERTAMIRVEWAKQGGEVDEQRAADLDVASDDHAQEAHVERREVGVGDGLDVEIDGRPSDETDREQLAAVTIERGRLAAAFIANEHANETAVDDRRVIRSVRQVGSAPCWRGDPPRAGEHLATLALFQKAQEVDAIARSGSGVAHPNPAESYP